MANVAISGTGLVVLAFQITFYDLEISSRDAER